ncbi:MAG TPA: TIGR03088 family PEP-CTERM/XrtA system glycosyltransferase [Crenotrichaceae bacterium]|nr:TIGR03088 family PEP-CTERM/XrtA system glycosyltransferase [Crenotrichaceae bacterium]
MSSQPPLITHIIYRLDVGGLENGLVNLINAMPDQRYRHAIICITQATDFRSRINKQDVPIYELDKPEGKSLRYYWKVFKLLRRLKPAIVHTRNLATIECQLPALLAGVGFRVHGEHGWDVYDPDGSNIKYQWVRRIFSLFIDHFVPLSQQLESYLRNKIHVKPEQITRICNGVDTSRFYPANAHSPITSIDGCPFNAPQHVLIGTVGRMHGVKDQLNLVQAFIRLRRDDNNSQARLLLVGEGPLRQQAISILNDAGLINDVWLPGARTDVADILRGLDIFVLPSSAEGISNTILEAMASALPVIATRVGGNPELVIDGRTGKLIPASNPDALAQTLIVYIQHPELRHQHGQAGLRHIQDNFSMAAMVNQYLAVYNRHLTKKAA